MNSIVRTFTRLARASSGQAVTRLPNKVLCSIRSSSVNSKETFEAGLQFIYRQAVNCVAVIFEDNAEAEVPLYSLRLQVREPPTTRTADPFEDRLLVAPVSAELVASGIVGCNVELAGLTKHPAMNYRRGRVVRIREDRGEED